MDDNNQRKKIGLALGSGGIKGFAHIGVIKTLEKYKIPIDFIAGSSAGAWAGTYYALYKNLEKLENYLLENKNTIIKSLLDPDFKTGLIKGLKMEKFFESFLNDSTFSDTKIPVAIVATDLISGEPVIFRQGKLAPALRASIAIPSFFKPIEYENKILVDGGVSNVVPDDIVKEMGADIVISVNLENHKRKDSFTKEKLTFSRVTERTIDLMLHYLAENTIKNSDVIIEPENCYEEISGWRNYLTKPIEEINIKKGQEATEAKIKEIQSLINS